MLPILTVENIDSHVSLYKNEFFDCFSSISEDWVILTVYPYNEETETETVKKFIDDKITDFINKHDCFIFDKILFGFAIFCKANDLDFGTTNEFFINLVDELNTVFGD